MQSLRHSKDISITCPARSETANCGPESGGERQAREFVHAYEGRWREGERETICERVMGMIESGGKVRQWEASKLPREQLVDT